MKKHELLKFAYDNYPKGTKFISGSKSKEIIESSGVFRISQNESQGTWVTDYVTSYVICSTNGKWVEIVKPKIAVKLPLLTSEDGVDLYEKDSIFIAVKRDEKWMLDWHADEAEDNEQFELTDNGKFISTEKEKYFSTKESALKWVEEQKPKVNLSKQEIALHKSAELWNSFLDIYDSEKHPDDTNDFRFHIHALQNILYTQMHIKEHGQLKELS